MVLGHVLIKEIMSEQLLSVKEAADYLGINKKKLKELVQRKIIPAYKIGGVYLRFRKDQLDKASLTIHEPAREAPYLSGETEQSNLEKIKDFLYFNDFYIVSFILVVLMVVIIFTP